ncbi:Ctnnbl1 [Symbiodinium sp. CCMP2456]|nr:Ctnnbl1 [Symbiodinium sp. CCMP2456]
MEKQHLRIQVETLNETALKRMHLQLGHVEALMWSQLAGKRLFDRRNGSKVFCKISRDPRQFERKVKVNRELRIKPLGWNEPLNAWFPSGSGQLVRKTYTNGTRWRHADDPDKFLKSEVDLDEEIKKFTLVATNPELYPALIKLETLPLMVGMLNHVNTDIAVDVFEVLSELTDPDAIADVEEPEVFLKALFEAQLCQMTVDVLMRIDETASDEDFKAVTNGLSMIENLADSMPQETCKQFLEIPNFLPWLIKRVRTQGAMDYNKVYASEILGIVLQNSEPARNSMVKLEGVDKLLRGIAAYRKRDPADSEESEYVQNMFDCLCSLMLLKANQLAFGRLQGLELMIRMMKERVFASNLALKLADHALRHCPENCQVFVEKLGLKVLFAIFMKRGAKTKKESEAKELEEHVTSIVQSLCRYCTGTPVARVLNKFVENQFEKLERLLEMHEEYNRSVKAADEAAQLFSKWVVL